MGDRISVIVPVYNVQEYLEKCIDSILRQSYQNLEVILVDDGATDQSGTKCDEYAVRDRRIQVIHKENGGLSDARNAGIEIASGQYMCFVDSDDYLEEDILQKAYQAAMIYTADVVIWGFYKDFYDSDQTLIRSVRVSHELCGCRKRNKDYQTLLAEDTQALVGYAWNKLYRTEVILRNNFRFQKGVSLVEDILFNSPVLCDADCVAFLDALGSHYIQRDRNTLGAKFYSDYYELKLQACKARERLLQAYGASEDTIKNTLIGAYFAAIKSSCRMACKSSAMNREEKQLYMQNVCTSRTAQDTLFEYHAKGKDRLLKTAIKMKQYWIFEVLYQT